VPDVYAVKGAAGDNGIVQAGKIVDSMIDLHAPEW
jgi:hypothetical protein